jgi:hypothetical protein
MYNNKNNESLHHTFVTSSQSDIQREDRLREKEGKASPFDLACDGKGLAEAIFVLTIFIPQASSKLGTR